VRTRTAPPVLVLGGCATSYTTLTMAFGLCICLMLGYAYGCTAPIDRNYYYNEMVNISNLKTLARPSQATQGNKTNNKIKRH
jgi:hypothetical protein